MGQRVFGVFAVLALGAGLVGCGGGSPRPGTHAAAIAGGPPGVAVIRGWSQALARGDIGAASAYFATPSRVQLDPSQPVVRVRSAADARTVNLSLPCGARLLDARPVGGYLDALFLLGTRPGAACNGIGGTARVAFMIRAGKIAVWRRIPDEPGDAAHAAPGAQPPGAPPPTPPTTRSI